MKVYDISKENIPEFASYVGEDIADDMKRKFYRGYGVKDDDGSVAGVLVYEVLGTENDDEDVRSAFRFLKAESKEAYSLLHQSYREDGTDDDEIEKSTYQFEDEEPADSCEEQGFSKEQKESDLARISLKDASGMDFVSKLKIPDHIVSIDMLSMMQFRTAIRNCLFNGQKGLLEDLGNLSMGWFDIELSTCTIMDDEVKGLFLVRVTPSGTIIPVLLFVQGADSRKNLARMIACSVKKAQEKYLPETQIEINCARSSTGALVNKLFPDVVRKTAYCGSRSEVFWD